MIKRTAVLLALLLPAAALSAAPVITSISPTTASVNPGTHVTIKGSGFSSCLICSPPLPPAVFFGGTPADSVRLIDSETLDATTPPHLPATVRVTVQQFDNTFAVAPQSFTFTGDPLEAFDRILVPIFTGPVHGAFGSEFVTVLRASNKSDSQTVRIYGPDLKCLAIMPVMDPITDPLEITGTGVLSYREIPPDCSNWPAIFLYVPKRESASLALNDRVTDVSRLAASHGTEIPIVHDLQTNPNRILLLGVPLDGRYRSTLRVYAATPMQVTVTIGGTSIPLQLQAGRTLFEPAYAQFSDFPIPVEPAGGGETFRVIVDGPPPPGGISPALPAPPIWAFITVTNNETQQITTISPD